MYIPSAPKVTNGTEEEKKALKRWYRHLSIAFFVKLFDQWASEPFSITFKSKKNHLVTKTVWFVVRVFTGLMDHPGAQVNAGYKSSARAKCPCRRCLVVHADIYETDCGIIGKYGMRDHEMEDEMRRIYWNPLSTKPMVSKSKSVLDEVSAQYEFPGLHREFPFYKPACEHLKPKNLASIFGFETMHLFLLGAPKRAFEYIYELFSVKDDEKKGTKRLRAGDKTIRWCKDQFNSRIAAFKSACIDTHTVSQGLNVF